MKKEYPDILKLEGEKWHNPNPATGKLGTRVPAEWLQTTEDSLKSLTLEMLEVLKSAGINPNELNNTQVRDAIQKMILSRVINYNDIQGRPVVKDSLGDDRNNPASQRVVNDVNRAANNAQTSANIANEKANTAQTTANQAKSAAATADSKADSAYNLANSKQDKLTFVGSGKVMREGAYGLGRDSIGNVVGSVNDLLQASSGFYFAGSSSEIGKQLGDAAELINLPQNPVYGSVLAITNSGEAFVNAKRDAKFEGWRKLLLEGSVVPNTASKNQNGWWKCGDTGLIYQWGQSGEKGKLSITFPISFPNYCASVHVTHGRTGTSANVSGAFNVTKSSFTGDIGEATSLMWFAVGY